MLILKFRTLLFFFFFFFFFSFTTILFLRARRSDSGKELPTARVENNCQDDL
jgi:hypothetical protein